MKFPSPLIRGVLIRRYRRSLADVRLDEGGVVTAHVFAMGPMTGCTEPGSIVMLSDSNDPGRWHPLSWELVEVGGVWVCVNPKITHALVHEALAKGSLEGFRGYTIESHRGAGKNQGIDFILLGAENNCFMSLQIVTHTEGGTAWFPDAPSEPARNVLRRLVEVVDQGHRAVAFFHVLRNDCDQLKLAAEIDKSYARALNEARKAGVELLAYRADVTSEDVSLGVPIPFSL